MPRQITAFSNPTGKRLRSLRDAHPGGSQNG